MYALEKLQSLHTQHYRPTHAAEHQKHEIILFIFISKTLQIQPWERAGFRTCNSPIEQHESE